MKIVELEEDKRSGVGEKIPMLVLGTSGLMTVFSIDLSAHGVKTIAKKINGTDVLRITFTTEGHKIEVLK